MNQTEAWEAVYLAAVHRWSKMPVQTKQHLKAKADLERALNKVSPRIHRMRSRLDFARAKKAGKLNRPSWATP